MDLLSSRCFRPYFAQYALCLIKLFKLRHETKTFPSLVDFAKSSRISSSPVLLPSSYGIGNLGSGGAGSFVDFLASSGIRFWQTCRLARLGTAIPLPVFSSFASNPYFIDWDPLIRIGLIREDELSSLAELPSHEVDYGRLCKEFFSSPSLPFRVFPTPRMI